MKIKVKQYTSMAEIEKLLGSLQIIDVVTDWYRGGITCNVHDGKASLLVNWATGKGYIRLEVV